MNKTETHPNWYHDIPKMKYLILGSFPPPTNHASIARRSRHYDFYYPNKNNYFWKCLAKAFGKNEFIHNEGDPAVQERKHFMETYKVGLNDTALKIRRKERSTNDTDLEVVELQDLKSVIAPHLSTLRTIVLPGYHAPASTYRSFQRYFKELKDPAIYTTSPAKVGPRQIFYLHFNNYKIRCVIMNSTSRAARKPLEEITDQFIFALEL